MARRQVMLAIAGAGLLAALLLARRAQAAEWQEGYYSLDAALDSNAPSLLEGVFAMMQPDIAEALRSRNVQAFLAMLGEFEGGPEGYAALFGGGRFDSFADHPRTIVTAGGYSSSAAGKYQILARTWDDVRGAIEAPDFTPYWQDVAAVYLIRRRGALADVMAGNFDAAIAKLGKEWASLPGSPYGQPMRSLADARAVYADAGGNVA
jgi:muramidase (phage lysozyme)